jgi:hypothetical protein
MVPKEQKDLLFILTKSHNASEWIETNKKQRNTIYAYAFWFNLYFIAFLASSSV